MLATSTHTSDHQKFALGKTFDDVNCEWARLSGRKSLYSLKTSFHITKFITESESTNKHLCNVITVKVLGKIHREAIFSLLIIHRIFLFKWGGLSEDVRLPRKCLYCELEWGQKGGESRS